MDIRVTVNERDLARLKKEFRFIPGASEKALVAALNRTVVGVRAEAVREITKVYEIKARDVRETMALRRASRSRIEAAVISQGGAIGLHHFKISPRSFSLPRPPSGVRVKVRRDGAGRRLRGPFLTNRIRGVYRRKNPGDPKDRRLEQLFGPAVPSMLKDEGAFGRVQWYADARLSKEIDGQIERILRGF